MIKNKNLDLMLYTFIAIVLLIVIVNNTSGSESIKKPSNSCQIKQEKVRDTIIVRDTVFVDSEYGETLDEWQMLIMAIMYVESRYDTKAKSGSQIGCMQITQTYIDEVNRLAGTHYKLSDAYSMEKSLDIFITMNDYKNPERDINKAIRLHNAGNEYRNRILKEFDIIKKYEKARKDFKNSKPMIEYEKTRDKLVGLYSECD